MRKRKLAQNRIDRMTGSMDTLDDILHRIQDAESNEMVNYPKHFELKKRGLLIFFHVFVAKRCQPVKR